jgi:hypothetical protein
MWGDTNIVICIRDTKNFFRSNPIVPTIFEGKIAKSHLQMRGFHLTTCKNLLFSQTLTSFKFFQISTYIHLSYWPSCMVAMHQQNNSCRRKSTSPLWQHVYVNFTGCEPMILVRCESTIWVVIAKTPHWMGASRPCVINLNCHVQAVMQDECLEAMCHVLLMNSCHTWLSIRQVDTSGNMKKLKTCKCLVNKTSGHKWQYEKT